MTILSSWLHLLLGGLALVLAAISQIVAGQ